jgi:hypothetical protein
MVGKLDADDVGKRLSLAFEQSGETRHSLMLALKEISEERQSSGGPGLPKINRRAVYDLYVEGGPPPPLPTLEAIADVLDIRREWLAFGTGPMERSAISDPVRELYLVDGAISRGHGRAPETAAERRRVRREFRRAFNEAGHGEARLGSFVYTVHVMFANHLARWMQRRRDDGSQDPDDPTWRGHRAREQLNSAMKRARGHGLGADSGAPEATAAMLRALADMMIAENPKGGTHDAT